MSREVWSGALSGLLSGLESTKKPVIEEHMDEISSIADNVIDLLKDGFQWSDVVGFYKVIGPIMDIAKNIDQYGNEQKEQFVVDVMWIIYQGIDTYPDGESNRINIPVLFGGMEKKFEEKMVDMITRSAVKAVYSFGKQHGYF